MMDLTFDKRQLVPRGGPINAMKRDDFGYYMKTDGVFTHVNNWILETDDENVEDVVQKIGPVYGKGCSKL
jgi:hypothetical protein